MTATTPLTILVGEVVLPCPKLQPTLDFFTYRLGFALEMIMPADDPSVAVITGSGVRVRLVVGAQGDPGHLRLGVAGTEQSLVAPNGTRIELVDPDAPIDIPAVASALELSRLGEEGWGVGRAGMLYRDLLPTRQGGRFIASHIRIADAGPVPDDVHHHRIRFQLIHCVAGWVRLVYEDQGPPFVLAAGDSVLQPPGIRHRVVECSAGVEVVEVGCPAEHETYLDHAMTLPTPAVDPPRRFGGQRFVRHEAATATWHPWQRDGGFEVAETGIGAATDGLGGARVVRAGAAPADGPAVIHDGELLFWFVTGGSATLAVDGRRDERLVTADAVAIPAGLVHALRGRSDDFELLEVSLPDRLKLSRPACPRC